jgi:putative Mn2+ efflux pump MntP
MTGKSTLAALAPVALALLAGAILPFQAARNAMVGRLLGHIAGRWAEAVGGLLLIGIGSVILFEHLTAV